MAPETLAETRNRIEADLRQNILPCWIEHAVDHERGTFHAQLSNDLRIDDSGSRGALLSSRILWTYAAAFRVYGDDGYREMADFAYGDLIERFLDPEHGGFYWSIHADDRPEHTRKQVYGQAFAIYALAEYYRTTGWGEPLARAQDLFFLLENRAKDREQGGYFEAFARDWSPIDDVRLSAVDQNDPKSQNTLLHMMEAYTTLWRVWPDERVGTALKELVETMLDRVVNAQTSHLGLFFTRDWQVTSDRYSYGHDIEAAWLLWEAACSLRDDGLSGRVLATVIRIAEVTLAEGCDADGAIFNEGSAAGVTNDQKEWWPQAEGVVGFLCAAQLSGDDRYLQAALRLWTFIETKLIDHEHGEWFRGVNRAGDVEPRFEKIGFWKCPYHNGRAAIEAIARLNALGAD